jgi:hypothetical protein
VTGVVLAIAGAALVAIVMEVRAITVLFMIISKMSAIRTTIISNLPGDVVKTHNIKDVS